IGNKKEKGEKRKHIRGNFTTLTILHHLHLWTVVALLHSPDEDQQTPPSAVLSRSQGRSFHVVVVQLASHLPFASNFSHPSRAASPTPAPSASVRGNSPDTNSAAIHIHFPFIVNDVKIPSFSGLANPNFEGDAAGFLSVGVDEIASCCDIFSGVILRKISMEEANEILKNNRIEDISWLCSLSESELDLLISIKMLVLQRAKAIGHENLAEKFDLKTLRTIGFVLMEHLKGELRTSDVTDLSQSALNACNLLDSNLEKSLPIDEIMTSICLDRRKKPGKRLVPFTCSCVCIVQDHILERIVKCHGKKPFDNYINLLVFIKPSIHMNFHHRTYALDSSRSYSGVVVVPLCFLITALDRFLESRWEDVRPYA
uniref:Uncharacterized protein n=1 Tax=Cucumis melo TaxID=3656 RepID=A0A9I9DRZ1_CUCME